MDEALSWVDVAGVVAGIFSTLTAIIALWVAVRSDRRSRDALKVQTYLQLRSQFIDIYRHAGPLEEESQDIDVILAREAYWHNAWDEYFITRELAPREFATLWDRFFKGAIESGLTHPALVKTLDRLAAKDVGFGRYARNLVAEIRTMQKSQVVQRQAS